MTDRDDAEDLDGDETSPPSDDADADEREDDVAAAPLSGDADGDTPGPDEQYCASCGEVIKRRAEICPHCGVRNRHAPSSARKDRTAAGVLAILLGGIGAHKFYLGETGLGILYLCFFWTGIPAILGIIEGILYLTKTDAEFERQYLDD